MFRHMLLGALEFNDATISMVVTILATLIVAVWRMLKKDKQAEVDQTLKLFHQGVAVAYNVVNNLASKTENKIDDKVALALLELEKFLAPFDIELTPELKERAKQLFNAMHGAEKKGVKPSVP